MLGGKRGFAREEGRSGGKGRRRGAWFERRERRRLEEDAEEDLWLGMEGHWGKSWDAGEERRMRIK
jgi:hypothetical protein